MSRQRSIRKQVTLMTTTVVGVVTALVLMTTIAVAFKTELAELNARNHSMAQVVAQALTAAVAFDDSKAVTRQLLSLADASAVASASVKNLDGSLIAEQQGTAPQPPALVSLLIPPEQLQLAISVPIAHRDETLGTLTLKVDTWPAYRALATAVAIGLLLWVAGTFAAFFVAGRLNRLIVEPLDRLTRMVARVARDEDYSQRFQETLATIETETLGSTFNRLLNQIEDRDTRLQAAISAMERAKDEAEQAARSKSSFLANMSHEIRTPMNGVVGMTSLLRRTPLTEQQRLYFDTIESSANSLLMIIDDILDFSKIEAGRLEIQHQPFSISEVLESLNVFFSNPAQQKGLFFTSELDEAVPLRILGDSGRVRQVLINLVGNAIKFTRRGGVSLKVSLTADETQTPSVKFTVTDTGIGIAEHQQAGIFGEFFQADGSTTRQFGGTGLGLAISKQLARLMDGDIGFTSTEGKGSTFWFSIPLATEVINPFINEGADPGSTGQSNPFAAALQINNAAEHVSGAASLSAPIDESATAINAKVLVAEDSDVNQFIIKELLQTFGVKPDMASNGQEAIEAFKTASYDLILMDVQMPVLDGVEATRAIRALQRESQINPDCVIVGLSAHAMAGDRERYMAEGMDDYLTKPVELSDLSSVMRRHLKTSSDMMLWR